MVWGLCIVQGTSFGKSFLLIIVSFLQNNEVEFVKVYIKCVLMLVCMAYLELGSCQFYINSCIFLTINIIQISIMSDNNSSLKINLTTDEDVASECSSTSSKSSWKNAKLNIRRLSKKEHLTEAEKIRLESARKLVEKHEKSKDSGSTSGSVHNSLINAMKDIGVKESETKSVCNSDNFNKVNEAFQTIKKLGDKESHLLSEHDARRLAKAREEILKWSQPSIGDNRSESFELTKSDLNSSSVRATAGTMKSGRDESPNSSDAKQGTLKTFNRSKFDVNKLVSPSLTTPFVDLAKADEGKEKLNVMEEPLSSFSN